MEVFTEKYWLKSTNTLIMIFTMNKTFNSNIFNKTGTTQANKYLCDRKSKRNSKQKEINTQNHASKLLYCSQFILKTSRLLITNLLINLLNNW